MEQPRKVLGYRPTPFFSVFGLIKSWAKYVSQMSFAAQRRQGTSLLQHRRKSFLRRWSPRRAACFLFGGGQRFTTRGLAQADRSVRCAKSATDQAGPLWQRASCADTRCGFCGTGAAERIQRSSSSAMGGLLGVWSFVGATEVGGILERA